MNYVMPIKDKDDIAVMKKLLSCNKYGVRDKLLFILGINSGLRVSDLLSLKVRDVVDRDMKISSYIKLTEKKTNKYKQFPTNISVQKALKEYLDSENPNPDDFLFKSRKGSNKPISRQQAHTIIKKAAHEAKIDDNIGTHSLRKTFAYHAYNNGKDIALLMDILNHSSPNITLRYIGITQSDKDRLYRNMNL